MPPSDRKLGYRLRALVALLIVLGPVSASVAQVGDGEAVLRLSGRGRFLVSGALAGSWSRDNEGRLGGTLTRWRVGATPSVTYFLRDKLGLGVHLGGGLSSGASANARRQLVERRAEYVQVGVHAAFDLPIAKRLSLFVSPGLAYVHEWIEDRPPFEVAFQQQGTLASAYRPPELGYVRFALSLPLVFHFSPSVAVGFGPELWFDLIVRRRPDYGNGSAEDDSSLGASLPRPARHRLQIGLGTALLIAL